MARPRIVPPFVFTTVNSNVCGSSFKHRRQHKSRISRMCQGLNEADRLVQELASLKKAARVGFSQIFTQVYSAARLPLESERVLGAGGRSSLSLSPSPYKRVTQAHPIRPDILSNSTRSHKVHPSQTRSCKPIRQLYVHPFSAVSARPVGLHVC